MMGAKTVQAIIRGRVQGVWYRAWTQRTAIDLGLSGWVRNRSDGCVEAVFSGPDDQVEKMLVACRQGPLLARVDGIEQCIATPLNEAGFHKRPDFIVP